MSMWIDETSGDGLTESYEENTHTSKHPDGTDTKYTTPSDVGSVGTDGPVTVRGDSAGVSVDDAAPATGGYAWSVATRDGAGSSVVDGPGYDR